MLKKLYSFLFVYDLLNQSAATAPVEGKTFKQKMMRDLAYLTLFSYILLVFSPVMPVISDEMAHTFWEKYHLLTVHGVYGNTHVNLEMNKAAKQTDKNKSTGNIKSSSVVYAHIIPDITYNFSFKFYIVRSYLPYKSSFPMSYTVVNYQPPKTV